MKQPPSERIVVQAPLSYSGSARRIWPHNRGIIRVLTVPLALLTIAAAWTLITGWYILFGLLVVPWRLVRRGQRKRRLSDARHRETMAALAGEQEG